MGNPLTIALPKGRTFAETCDLLRQAGYKLPEELDDTRKLMIDTPKGNLRFILAKPLDVTTYVEHGVADVGIAGKDVILEKEPDVYEVLDLKLSKCHLAIAGLPQTVASGVVHRVATKYPNIASKYFKEQGEQVEIIKLNGSIELAPLIGLTDRIVDIVSTGQTLRENGLIETETICDITSRFIVNPVSYRLKDAIIDEMASQLSLIVEGGTT
ncbi:ATP phosphoribosyltransferase [Bacillus changyiensis]|uniref:ATP phosphoribosyltransferase n=1 Tax=Bacillus changyiensis TaxID=3004103 RepID=UPI0022DF1D5A|nr:ATP phosphoribosyltransferase [Bacillus changyiensis]MDA1476516.1 ATP phosphoribosyltransferase [Bacillus changyiensis]